MVKQPNSDESILHNLEKELEEAERRSYLDRGRILKEIRGEGKYKTRFYQTAGFETFEEYCKERWDLARRTADQLVSAYEVSEILSASALKPLPYSEYVARSLTGLRFKDGDKKGEYDEEAIIEVWSNVLAIEGKITAQDVVDAVENYRIEHSDQDLDDEDDDDDRDKDQDDDDEEDDLDDDDDEKPKPKSRRSKSEEEEKRRKKENAERRLKFHDRFVKLLAMLGSDNDNEALSAGRMLEDMRKSMDCSWEDVLIEIYGTGLLSDVTLRRLSQHRAMSEKKDG